MISRRARRYPVRHYPNSPYAGAMRDVDHGRDIFEFELWRAIHKQHTIRPHREQSSQAFVKIGQHNGLRIDVHGAIFLDA